MGDMKTRCHVFHFDDFFFTIFIDIIIKTLTIIKTMNATENQNAWLGPLKILLILMTMMTVTTMMMMTIRKQAWGGFAGHTASGLAFLLLGNWLVG